MRKIDKDYSNIPISLIPAYKALFPTGIIHGSSRLTHQRRLELIKKGAYIDDDIYNSRYKFDDIRTELSKIYHNKCAFCEQKVELFHIEHYRPKKGEGAYYWLAFSWDNLLLACPYCNVNKGTNFSILGNKVTFVYSEQNLQNINRLSATYDKEELPLMINPEVIDPKCFLQFSRDGEVYSQDKRFQYTIDICKLNRLYLKDARRKIFDEFEKKLKLKCLKYANNYEKLSFCIRELIDDYISDTNDIDKEFIAYRQYSLIWLKGRVKTILNV